MLAPSQPGVWRQTRGRRNARHVLLLIALLLGLAGPAQGETASPSLTDAWLQLLAHSDRPIAWGHAFALRKETARDLPRHQTRLVGELDSLVLSARLQGERASAETLSAWQTALALQAGAPLRTPGRLDLPWLGAQLRPDPPLDKLDSWGFCTVPEWVEVWHHTGVVRLPVRAGESLRELLQRLPEDAWRRADHARVISATGQIQRVGVAAWNREPAMAGPGGRVLLELPEPARAPLPFASRQTGTVTLAWLHDQLAEVLAGQLPGDDCEVLRQP